MGNNLMLISMSTAAVADPVDVTYTVVSGSAGNWLLDFSVTNNISSTQDIYFFGVESGNLVASPNGWGQWNNGTVWGTYNVNWVTNTPYTNPSTTYEISYGQTLDGFWVVDHSLEPTNIAWFAYSDGPDGNPGFSGIATNAVLGPPAAPTDSAVVNGYVNATAVQALTGTADNGSTVTVYDNGTQVGTTKADASTGIWSFPVGVLADGSTHSYTVTATDAAGNVSQPSDVLNFLVDTTAPTVAIMSTGGLTNQATHAVHGTVDFADSGTTVIVLDGAIQVGTAKVQGDGTWITSVMLRGHTR
jgi:Bacterial Ig-like domain